MATTPVLLPGKSHGQRSLVGYSPWGHKESDTTKRLYLTLLWSNQVFLYASVQLVFLFRSFINTETVSSLLSQLYISGIEICPD